MTSGFGMVVTALRVAAAALFAAFNLMPLYGIYAWGWDAFQLLLLYWGETVLLFVCTLAHIALIPPARLGTMIVNGNTMAASRPMMVGFFAVHGGVFITAHLFFLCMLFSGAEFSRLNGVADFLRTFFIASGAWVPLLLAALAGVIDVLVRSIPPSSMRSRDGCTWRLRAPQPRPRATRSAALSAAFICASSLCRSRLFSAPWSAPATAHWRRSSSSSHSRR